MRQPPPEPDTRISVRLSQEEYALLPSARTVSQALRRAILEASATRELDRRMAQLGEQMATVATQLNALDQALDRRRTEDDDNVRLARLEVFIVQIAEAQARFFEQYCALQAMTETHLTSPRSDPSTHADAARRERHDALLQRLFDGFDLQVQEMAAQVLATNNAPPTPHAEPETAPDRHTSQAAE